MAYHNNSTQGTSNGYTASGTNSDAGGSPHGSRRTPYQLGKNGVERIFSDSNSSTMQALSELKLDGYSREFAGKLILEDKCNELLNALGFSTTEIEELSPGLDSLKNFSLIGSENEDQTIQNQKILDPNLDKLTPNPEAASDKFKSESDPFYDLDDEKSLNIENITKKEKSRKGPDKLKVILAKRLAERSRNSRNKMIGQNQKRFVKTK